MRQFLLRLAPHNVQTLEADVKVVERVEKDVAVADGDEVVCMMVGTAHVFSGGREVEIRNPQLVKIVEVRRPSR